MEKWKDIKGYEGSYQVSSMGHIRSLDRYGKRTDTTIRKLKGRVLKPFPVNGGYLSIYLCDEHGKKSFKVHRLVALTFIQKPSNKNEVNHKDGDKQNNSVVNLEWVTRAENNQHAFRVLNRVPIMKGKYNELCPNSKCVLQYDLFGKLIKEWPSTMEIERTKGWYASNISSCCRGVHKSAYGFIWKYK